MSAITLTIVLAMAAPSTAVQDRVLRAYLECAAPRRAEEMRLMLDTTVEEVYVKAAKAVTDVARCATTDAAMDGPFMAAFGPERGKLRGIAAEVLYRRAAGKARLATLPQQKVYVAAWFARTGRPFQVDAMALCVASTNPGGVQALLETQPASRGQGAALSALKPSFGSCLAKGYQLDTRPAGLRAALAEALWHRMIASPAAGAGARL